MVIKQFSFRFPYRIINVLRTMFILFICIDVYCLLDIKYTFVKLFSKRARVIDSGILMLIK